MQAEKVRVLVCLCGGAAGTGREGHVFWCVYLGELLVQVEMVSCLISLCRGAAGTDRGGWCSGVFMLGSCEIAVFHALIITYCSMLGVGCFDVSFCFLCCT